MIRTLLPFLLALFTTSLYAQGPAFQWAKQIGGENTTDSALVQGMVVDKHGNTYSTGRYRGTVDFDPGPATENRTSTREATYILKTDVNGRFLWVREVVPPPASGVTGGYTIAMTPDGDVVIGGQFSIEASIETGSGSAPITGLGGTDVFLLKFSSEGNLVWSRTFSGYGNETINCISIDEMGNILASGTFRGVTDFDPEPPTTYMTARGTDAYIVRLDINGRLMWAKQLASRPAGFSTIYSVVTDKTGNVYATGNYRDTVDFDPGVGPLLIGPVGGTDMFVIKLDHGGNLAWVRNMGGKKDDISYGLCMDKADNLFFTGGFRDTVDFEAGPGVTNLIGNSVTGPDSTDIFVAKMNSGGTLLWAKSIGGEHGDWGRGIVADDAGHIFFTGSFADTVDFDPGSGVFSLTAGDATGADAFVCQWDTTGQFVWAGVMGGNREQHGKYIATNGLGLIYTAGSFIDTVDFDPGLTEDTLMAPGYSTFLQQLGSCTLKADVEKTDSMLLVKDEISTYQWVTCPAYVPITGADSQAYHPTAAGSYAVIISRAGCTDTSDCIPMYTSGINDPVLPYLLSVAPNPATGSIAVTSGIPVSNASLQLLDFTGRVVYMKENLSGSQWQIDISNFPAALYFVRLTTADRLFEVQKLLKQ